MKSFVFAGFLLAVAVLGRPPSTTAAPGKAAPTRVRLGGAAYRISGPNNHKNLSVFLLHGVNKSGANFLTLQEGLKSRDVRIAEKDQEQVGELVISNDSDRPLFLQEGDRVIGGKQDRIISSSLVIPPHSRRVPLPAFCVEPGRWTEGAMNRSFGGSAEPAMAPPEVRKAAKIENDQSKVWDRVAREKRVAGTVASSPQKTTSLSEAMESPGFRKVADDTISTLKDLAANYPDAVGVAIAVNGRIEEVDVYPNHSLMVRLYPRLLRSFALEAASRSGQVRAAALRPSDVASFLSQNKSGKRREQRIDAQNRIELQDRNTAVQMQTNYNGAAVHQQFMRK